MGYTAISIGVLGSLASSPAIDDETRPEGVGASSIIKRYEKGKEPNTNPHARNNEGGCHLEAARLSMYSEGGQVKHQERIFPAQQTTVVTSKTGPRVNIHDCFQIIRTKIRNRDRNTSWHEIFLPKGLESWIKSKNKWFKAETEYRHAREQDACEQVKEQIKRSKGKAEREMMKAERQMIRSQSPYDVIMVVFDLTDSDSFAETQDLVNSARWACPGVPVILVGNKSDLVDERNALQGEAKRFAQERSLVYFETSVIGFEDGAENPSVDKLFKKAIELAKAKTLTWDVNKIKRDLGAWKTNREEMQESEPAMNASLRSFGIFIGIGYSADEKIAAVEAFLKDSSELTDRQVDVLLQRGSNTGNILCQTGVTKENIRKVFAPASVSSAATVLVHN